MTNNPSKGSDYSDAELDAVGDAFSDAVGDVLDNLGYWAPHLMESYSEQKFKDKVRAIAENDNQLVHKFVAELWRRVQAEGKS